MKRAIGLIVILFIAFSQIGCAETRIICDEPVQITYTDEDRLFYEECLQDARGHMCDPDRQDPEYLYRNQAEYSSQLSGKQRQWAAEDNLLWGLATEDDIPRSEALMIGYAFLDQVEHVDREEMKKYYADAWYNISDPQRSIWRVSMAWATEYPRNRETTSYFVYVDAASGWVLTVEEY